MIDRIARWKWILFGLIGLGIVAIWTDRRWHRHESAQDSFILSAAIEYGMDPALVKAVIWRESRFQPDARGTKGELGLMQISEVAAIEWASSEGISNFRHEMLLDPAMNTLAGTWYLAKVLKRYSQTDAPYAYALADYNAGRTHVLRWIHGAGSTNSQVFLEQMDYPTTRHYVESILDRYRRYVRDFNTADS